MIIKGGKHTYRGRTLKKGVMTLNKKVDKLAKVVNAQKPETKIFRSLGAPYIYQSGSLIRPLTTNTQGVTDVNNRIGDKIRLVNFNMRFYVEIPTTVAFGNVRFILFQYKHNPDAVVSTDSTIINLLMDSSTNNTTYFPQAYYDKDNRSSFRVLKDTGAVMINHSDTSTATARNFVINYSFKPSNAIVEFVQNGSTVSKNELMLLCISNFASSSVQIVYQYQLSYTDA